MEYIPQCTMATCKLLEVIGVVLNNLGSSFPCKRMFSQNMHFQSLVVMQAFQRA